MSDGEPALLHQILASRLVGGAAVIAIRLSAAAANRGFECSAWVPGDGPAADALDRAHVRTRRYDFEGLRGSRLMHLGACARMVPGLVGRHRPIVHVHNPTVFGLVRPALSSVRARAVVHFHSEPSTEEIAWTLKSPPEHIVTCAKHIAASVTKHTSQLARPVAVTTVPNAVDTERFTPGDPAEARARLGVSTNRFVVIMLANLAPNKGQVTALQAIAELIRRGVAVECWLVGEDRAPGREAREAASRLHRRPASGRARPISRLPARRPGPAACRRRVRASLQRGGSAAVGAGSSISRRSGRRIRHPRHS